MKTVSAPYGARYACHRMACALVKIGFANTFIFSYSNKKRTSDKRFVNVSIFHSENLLLTELFIKPRARRLERGLNRRRQCRFHTRASPLRRLAKPMRLSRFAGNIVYTFPQAEIANPLPISPCFRGHAVLASIGKPARAYNVLTYASGLGDLSTKHKRKWARQTAAQASI